MKLKILVLDDGNRGNLVQSEGIACRMNRFSYETLKVELKGPRYKIYGRKDTYPVTREFLALLCRLRFWNLAGRLLFRLLPADVSNIIKNARYEIIISAGFVLSPVNLVMARLKGVKSVNIMLPSIVALKDFDYLVIPCHDYEKIKNKNLNNLIVTLGAPNSISNEVLQQGARDLEKKINAKVNSRILGIIIGGNDQNHKISKGWVQRVISILNGLSKEWNFMLSTSKRTDSAVSEFIQDSIKDSERFIYKEFPGYSAVSHYHGLLGLSDVLLVTEDSVNMVSEAVTSGKPVIMLGVERRGKKSNSYRLTMEKLIERGLIKYLPLDETGRLPGILEGLSPDRHRDIDEALRCAKIIERSFDQELNI